MRFTVFLCLLFQTALGYCQLEESPKGAVTPALLGVSQDKDTLDIQINYFPFYKGVQLIEVHYYERYIPRTYGAHLRSIEGVWNNTTSIRHKSFGYLIRSKVGQIIRKYGVDDIRALKLQSPKKAPTITHKKRLEDSMVEWYNINGNQKYTKRLANGYGYSYREADNSYTILDTFGKERLSNYPYIAFLGSAYSVMEKGNYAFALFDQAFKQITPFKYGLLDLVSEGVFMANYQFINVRGELLDTTQYERIIFKRSENSHIIYMLGGKYGLMDRKLNHLTTARFKSIKPLNRNGYFVTNDKNKLAILNVDGEQITPFKYEPLWAYWREDGYLEVKQKHEGWNKNSKWHPIGLGLIDSMGQEVVLPRYEKVEAIQNGIGIAHFKGYKALVNTKREVLTEFIYDDLKIFENYVISEIQGKCGLLDSTGNELLPPQYKSIHGIKEGMVSVRGDNDKIGYKSLTNGIDIPIIYSGASHFINGAAWIILDGKQGLIDRDGKELTGFQYDQIYFYTVTGQWLVKKDGLFGAIDSGGNLIVPLIYTRTELLPDGTTKFSNENKSYTLPK